MDCCYHCFQCLWTTTSTSDGGVITTTTTCLLSCCFDYIKSIDHNFNFKSPLCYEKK